MQSCVIPRIFFFSCRWNICPCGVITTLCYFSAKFLKKRGRWESEREGEKNKEICLFWGLIYSLKNLLSIGYSSYHSNTTWQLPTNQRIPRSFFYFTLPFGFGSHNLWSVTRKLLFSKCFIHPLSSVPKVVGSQRYTETSCFSYFFIGRVGFIYGRLYIYILKCEFHIWFLCKCVKKW